ncbi:hypothetical protein CLCR_00061 [Cladophialophora carrionii]|uniref:Uncharacterized protein n=1 Tax=Cladophialophora carrionii TaxID=86049 RepID=A0A1C1CBQ2_9EURO|nr:hypothetical protein CLCR_00061 [Cladophialophora carrionii]
MYCLAVLVGVVAFASALPTRIIETGQTAIGRVRTLSIEAVDPALDVGVRIPQQPAPFSTGTPFRPKSQLEAPSSGTGAPYRNITAVRPHANKVSLRDLHTRQDNSSSPSSSSSNAGSALVYNACTFTVQSNIVHAPRAGDAGAPEEIIGAIAPGETFSHPFSHDPNMGISWKIWRTDGDNDNPVQFEYAWTPDTARIWYDMSMINAGEIEWLEPDSHEGETIEDGANNDGTGDLTGKVAVAHPFGGDDEGMRLDPQGGGDCDPVVCPAGEQYCLKAYNTDTDDQAMRDCAESADLRLTLCG